MALHLELITEFNTIFHKNYNPQEPLVKAYIIIFYTVIKVFVTIHLISIKKATQSLPFLNSIFFWEGGGKIFEIFFTKEKVFQLICGDIQIEFD